MARRGKLIAFEGIDGSGKSTALATVARQLQESGLTIHVTREETTSWTGDAVRRSISERTDPWVTLHLFLADRAGHMDEIEAALAAGKNVLTDRYMHSTLAYQGAALASRLPGGLAQLDALHEPWCIRPDGVLYFDVAPEVAVARAEERGDTTPYEKIAFLGQVRDNYLKLAAGPEFATLDAAQSPGDVAAAALGQLEKWLN